MGWINNKYNKGKFNFEELLKEVCLDSYDRLIFPSIEREVRSELTDKANEQAIKMFEDAAGKSEPSLFTALTPDENRIMGAYLATPEEKRDELLLKLVEETTVELQEKRKELF